MSNLFNFYRKSGRRYKEIQDTWRCYDCKNSYDAELLGKETCPRCNKKMKHPKEWTRVWVHTITGEERL
jgi:Zn finger protein HypA/HybF involved in hydrogenase expression